MVSTALPPLPVARDADDGTFFVAEDVVGLTTLMVNVFFVGAPGEGSDWVLVDSGIPPYGQRILESARRRFGSTPPRAIVLTHGHFDHVGTIHTLLQDWPNVPVFAHEQELPFLTGQAAYPPADPSVGGGLMARTSWLLPRRPIDISSRVWPLPPRGVIPALPEWRWVHTPGHTPGHVSLYRERDGVLLAGDAFVTQKQESILGVLTRATEIHGPPWYFTPDWNHAEQSVQTLADLQPQIAATGHGLPIRGAQLSAALERLSSDFRRVGMPADGRYVRAAENRERVTLAQPSEPMLPPAAKIALVLGGVALAYWLTRSGPRRSLPRGGRAEGRGVPPSGHHTAPPWVASRSVTHRPGHYPVPWQ